MNKLVAVSLVVSLAACSKKSDECEAAVAKSFDVASKLSDDHADRAQVVAECHDTVAKHPEAAKTVHCVATIAGEVTRKKLAACQPDGSLHRPDDEVSDHLGDLQDGAKAYLAAHHTFPVGKAGPLPVPPIGSEYACCCCGGKSGGTEVDNKCPPSTEWASSPVWSALGFAVTGPGRYIYSYESDGKTFTALAVGDLDCDRSPATYRLDGSIDASGAMAVALTKPPAGTY